MYSKFESSSDGEQNEVEAVTPGDSSVPEEGLWHTIASFAFLRWQTILQSFSESCCGKIKSFFMFITLPCYVVVIPVLAKGRSQPHYKIGQASIIYFYILLACTIVFNLWEQQVRATNAESSISYQLLEYFETTCMFVTVIFLIYINNSTRGRVIYGSRERNLILYFRTGLYVFGVSSLVYTMLNIVNYSNCGNAQHIILNTVKSLYIAAQILFLNRFYQAKLPNNPELQIALAHVLGTNLSLWIWTLCRAVYKPSHQDEKCRWKPLHLGSIEKYFYPLFVEYLLLVAGMMYELWSNLQVTDGALNHGDSYARYSLEQVRSSELVEQLLPSSNQPRTEEARRRRRNLVPSIATSLVVGLLFASVFIAFVSVASDSTKGFQKYLIINMCLYCSQILVCYAVLVFRQSQRRNERRSPVDLDDALLYFGLAGIILWEGFHFYALCFLKNPANTELAHGALAILEQIIQTVTLVSARRYCSRNDKNAKKIASCALFLLATNFALWCHNSFYMEQGIQNPGENHKSLKKLEVFGNILNPIIIFFRFHSATCCYRLWSIFHHDD